MKTEEAKQMICPMLRNKCVAGECMSWSWKYDRVARAYSTEEGDCYNPLITGGIENYPQ